MKDLVFDLNAAEDLIYWSSNNPRLLKRILSMIKEVHKSPFDGIGKPEQLKYQFKGLWSRRINKEHRLIYKVENNKIKILACKFHYDK